MGSVDMAPVKEDSVTNTQLNCIQFGEQSKGINNQQALSSISRLSITVRLPLLIGTLLLVTLCAVIWAAYQGVKDAALEAGHERLRHVTHQLATLLEQSVSNTFNKTSAVANLPAVKTYLRSPLPGSAIETEVISALQPLLPPKDSNALRVELWNNDSAPVLALPSGATQIHPDMDAGFKQFLSGSASAGWGPIQVAENRIVYPLMIPVMDDAGRPVGHLVRWHQLAVTPEFRQRLINLIGLQSDLYLGNLQGEVWTDFLKVVAQPPVDVRSIKNVVHYSRNGISSVTAWGRPISGTPWFVLVEFSDQQILAQANRFLRRMIIIGAALLVFGLTGAVLVSRSITKPLHSLTDAASAIARGDYSCLVPVRTRDELGTLASAFNTMIAQVWESHHELEKKVQERTAQFETANRELESFSYSVSHDLRAPLRAMAGFSGILIEEYGTQLPENAQRYLRTVQDNAQQMGRLIDDLLAFSRLGRKPLLKQPVSLTKLVREVFDELLNEQAGRLVEIVIGDLPNCQADPTLLKQVLVNLLANALKFTRKKDTAVIEVGCLSQEQAAPVYFVKDNGAGFDMRYADKLFGVFQRLHRADEYEGTGVGLAIVQRIIRRHGGRIWAEAVPDKGATFYFTLGGESYG